MNNKVARFGVSSDPSLLDEFDETIKKLDYIRSSAIKRSMRNFLADYRWTIEIEAKIAGAITMVARAWVQVVAGSVGFEPTTTSSAG